MKKYFYVLSILFLSLIGYVSDSCAQNKELYFCEEYRNGKEIGVSNVFTTGWLTVMVDLRISNRTFETGKIDLRISRIKDENDNIITEKIIDTVPFEVQPDWDYTYFVDKDDLKFTAPGTYRVICQKSDGTPITEGQVKIISK